MVNGNIPCSYCSHSNTREEIEIPLRKIFLGGL